MHQDARNRTSGIELVSFKEGNKHIIWNNWKQAEDATAACFENFIKDFSLIGKILIFSWVLKTRYCQVICWSIY